MNGGYRVNPPHMDLRLALAGLGDVVGSLHPHERIHLHSEGLLNAERHVSGKVSLPVEQAGQSGPGHLERGRRRWGPGDPPNRFRQPKENC